MPQPTVGNTLRQDDASPASAAAQPAASYVDYIASSNQTSDAQNTISKMLLKY